MSDALTLKVQCSHPGLLLRYMVTGGKACAHLAGVSSPFMDEVSAVHPKEQHRNSRAQ